MRTPFLATLVAALTCLALSTSLTAASPLQCKSVEPVSSSSAIETARLQCPALAAIIEKFAMADLGEVVLPEQPASKAPQLLPLAVAAAAGDEGAIRTYSRDAADEGATRFEFEELLYLTAVHAGVKRAMTATRILLDVVPIADAGS